MVAVAVEVGWAGWAASWVGLLGKALLGWAGEAGGWAREFTSGLSSG